jgi:hypothetical protein
MPGQKKLRPKFGTHVTGAGFWPGAAPSPDSLVARLASGESVKIFGLRRIGKSSLLYETARVLTAHHRPVIQLDGQQLHTIPSLLKEIISNLPLDKGPIHRLLDWSRNVGLPPEVKSKLEALITEKIVGTSEPALDAYAELLFKELGVSFAALPPAHRPVLFIDELPWFCDNVMKAAPAAERAATAARLNNLLAVLRAWRGEDIGIAMSVCGSLSMAWLQREHGIQSEHLNDCMPVQVEELSLDEAVAMVKAMIAFADRPDWQDGMAERLCALLPSLFPGVVQFAFSVIRLEPCLTLHRLEEIYGGKIADGLQSNYYNQFDKRIGHYTAAERSAAYALFAAVLDADGVIPWHEAVGACGETGRVLLDRLMEDGFVRASRKAGVRFASGLALHWFRGRE